MSGETRPFSIAIAALGGQGGGVLSNWLVELAEANGYIAQYTSVPGVAQRTGATIYYIEIFPRSAVEEEGREPVLALMPVPGDVDVVIAAELMEAGRAIDRGIVTPERTTLIASVHREYAVSEKSAMADGRARAEVIERAARESAGKFVSFDMAAEAEAAGSVISAVLFGAVAGAGVLPFDRATFEETIRASGRMVDENLAGFGRGFDGAAGGRKQVAETAPTEPDATETPANAGIAALLERIEKELPPAARRTARIGAERLVDFQGPAYADLYLDRVGRIAKLDGFEDGRDFRLTTAVAKYLALWMSYEDTVRVADLKTRSSRFDRVRGEVHAKDADIVYASEFMHPRLEEFCDTLPAPIGRAIQNSRLLSRLFAPFFRSGRRIETNKLGGFLLLYLLASMRRLRPISLRYQRENAAIEEWLGRIERASAADYELAVEIAECQRLIKGYGDTHARGMASFNRIMAAADALGAGDDAAVKISQWRDAALSDPTGETLGAALGE